MAHVCKVVGSNPDASILDGHFFALICCKNCIDVCLKRLKINEKEAGVGPLKTFCALFYSLQYGYVHPNEIPPLTITRQCPQTQTFIATLGTILAGAVALLTVVLLLML